MSKYTVTIKNLIDNKFNFGLNSYPIFNETYREILNQKILNHYYMDEIGLETANLFKFYLNNKMNEIMPYYNELYKAQEKLLSENIFDNVDFKENSSRDTTNNTNSNSQSESNGKALYQDTPQGTIDMTAFEDQTYATNLNLNKSNINDTSQSEGKGNELFERIIKGTNGNKYKIDILNDIKNNLMNIDMMIINELQDLFLGLY